MWASVLRGITILLNWLSKLRPCWWGKLKKEPTDPATMWLYPQHAPPLACFTVDDTTGLSWADIRVTK